MPIYIPSKGWQEETPASAARGPLPRSQSVQGYDGLENQVAQKHRPLNPKVDHNGLNLALNYQLLAVQGPPYSPL